MSVAALDEMIAAANNSGKLFTVHQNRRFDVDYLAIKGIVKSEEIGDVIRIESRIHGSRGIPSDWRCTKAQGGGMILDWGVHLIDQLLQIFKEKIVSINCVTTNITNTAKSIVIPLLFLFFPLAVDFFFLLPKTYILLNLKPQSESILN